MVVFSWIGIIVTLAIFCYGCAWAIAKMWIALTGVVNRRRANRQYIEVLFSRLNDMNYRLKMLEKKIDAILEMAEPTE